jgi:hypothetical protein
VSGHSSDDPATTPVHGNSDGHGSNGSAGTHGNGHTGDSGGGHGHKGH